MTEVNSEGIDSKIISELGLRRSEKRLNADSCPGGIVYDYPHLRDVFIMEYDLYGNKMPAGSCFLAFYGTHGLIGKHLLVETLVHSSVNEIRDMVASNNEG